jgi:hypothetical protein
MREAGSSAELRLPARPERAIVGSFPWCVTTVKLELEGAARSGVLALRPDASYGSAGFARPFPGHEQKILRRKC